MNPDDTVTAEDGSRFYEIDGENYWSVTTALHIITKEGLTWWAAGLAADYAFTELPRVVAASITKPCGRTHNVCKQGRGDNGHDWRITCPTCPCTNCHTCVKETMRRLHIVKRDERADEGKRLHDWVENWVITGGQHAPIHDDILPYVRAFLAFVAAYGLTPDSWLFTEARVINRAEKYAGTTDGAIRFVAGATVLAHQLVARVLGLPLSQVGPDMYVDVIFDAKTKTALKEGKSVTVYPSVALQMGGYRWAPIIKLKTTGEERGMPDLHGALALQLYPDLAVPRLCVADEMTYLAFLNALNLYRWHVEFGTASTSERSFPLLPEPKPEPVVRTVAVEGATVKAPGTRKPPAKKATKAAAAPAVEPVQDQLAALATSVSSAARTRAAAKSSATIASIVNKPAAHPNSPYDDEIPF